MAGGSGRTFAKSREAGEIAATTPSTGGVYLVPAFTGLGAPYWDSDARAILCGMNSATGKAEIVRAAEECIAYQVADIVGLMREQSGVDFIRLSGDGGPTRDCFLMQFQADMNGFPLRSLKSRRHPVQAPLIWREFPSDYMTIRFWIGMVRRFILRRCPRKREKCASGRLGTRCEKSARPCLRGQKAAAEKFESVVLKTG